MTQYSMKHMKTFCTVVECGGFISAQSTLGMSQPAISTHIRDFEIRLGFQLCLRGRSGFNLTQKGSMVYEKCRAMLNEVSDFEADLGELRDKLTGSLRVGIIDSIMSNTQLPIHKAIERFFNRENEVTINLEVLPPEELEKKLLNGQIHIAIGPFKSKDTSLAYHFLLSEEHKFYCANNHPLFNLSDKEISWRELQKHTASSRAYLHQSDLPGIKNNTIVSNMEAQLTLIRSGHFMGFLPAHYADQWVESGELRPIQHLDIEHFSKFYLATRQAPHAHNIVKVFVDDIEAIIAEQKQM